MRERRYPRGTEVFIKEGLPYECWESVGLTRMDYEGAYFLIGSYQEVEHLMTPSGEYKDCDTYYLNSLDDYPLQCWVPTYMFEHIQIECMFPHKEVNS